MERVNHFSHSLIDVTCVKAPSQKTCGDTTAAIATWTCESRRAQPGDSLAAGSYFNRLTSRTPGEPMNRTYNFKTAFCERFEHPHENFENRVFWNALHPEMKPVALLIRWLRPSFFRSDLDCIRSIAHAESKEEVRAIINSLQYDPTFKRGFFRGVLRVRISGRRLTRLAGRVLTVER